MSTAIRVESLGKSYRLGQGNARVSRYRTLRESLVGAPTAIMRYLHNGLGGARSAEFWALKDVDLEIQPGEVVGIIGRNGAGKSTLLKIFSRITKPTTGQVELRGRVGSLLEVGTGFHPELTGRENIYLNGAILGMSRREIERKFDEIVAFAEVERFLDTPVKRFSSGMYVRLAFAVAAYLEPEILIVDEVLAVGDMAFQRKCLGRMQEVGRSGRTVLFVSHNMPALESLCSRAILLDHGLVVADDSVPTVLAEYRRRAIGSRTGETCVFDPKGPGRITPILRSAELRSENGNKSDYIPLGGTFQLRIEFDVPRKIELPAIAAGIDDSNGQRILTLHTPLNDRAIPHISGRCAVDCVISQFPLAPGEYWIKLEVASGGTSIDVVERALQFTVVDGEAFGQGRGFTRGLCVAPVGWEMIPGEITRTTGAQQFALEL
jgi:homopolymeric O-antigen transport system ATP-binding protein